MTPKYQSVSLPISLIEEMEKQVGEHGYVSVTEFVKDACRRRLEATHAKTPAQPVMATMAKVDIYELYTLWGHTVTAEEAAQGAPAIQIPDIKAHSVVLENPNYARGYVDGILTPITNVNYKDTTTSVHFEDLTRGEVIDIIIPVTCLLQFPFISVAGDIDENRLIDEFGMISTPNYLWLIRSRNDKMLKKIITTPIAESYFLLDVTYLSPIRHEIYHEAMIQTHKQDSNGQTAIKFSFEP